MIKITLVWCSIKQNGITGITENFPYLPSYILLLLLWLNYLYLEWFIRTIYIDA